MREDEMSKPPNCTHGNVKLVSFTQQGVWVLGARWMRYQVNLLRCTDCDQEFYKTVLPKAEEELR